MAWVKCSIEKGDVMLSGPFAMCIKHPKDVLTLHKHIRREIVNMKYPTDSLLVIQTMDGEHVVKYRFDVSHLETKKDKILVEVLERIRFLCVHSCFSCAFTFLHLYVFRCDDNVFHVVHVFVFLSCGSCFSCSDYMTTMCFFLTAMTLRLFIVVCV
jgi:hypothetical protein